MEHLDFSKYKGVRSTLPAEGQRRFCLTLCFFKPAGRSCSLFAEALAGERKGALIRWISNFDLELCEIIKVARRDLLSSKIRIYMGDPEEELEAKLESWAPPIGLDWEGYLNITRAAILAKDDSLLQTDQECDLLAGEFNPTEHVSTLFRHIERSYLSFDLI